VAGQASATGGGRLRDWWFDGSSGWVGAAESGSGAVWARQRRAGQINFFTFAIKSRAVARVRGRGKRAPRV
jgi:hypothetical protein